MKHLDELINRQYGRSEMNAGDFPARALYRAGHLFGRPRRRATDALDVHLAWPQGTPITKAWERLGQLPPPGGSKFMLEDPGPGFDLRFPTPGQLQLPRIAMTISCNQDRRRLPKLTIEIEGKPVCVLMKAMFELEDQYERRATRKEAKRIWNSLAKRIYATAGVGMLQRGRPQENLIGRAAYLKYHKGETWRQVSEQLCQQKHRHTKACQERFRKGVEKLWERSRRNARRLPPVS